MSWNRLCLFISVLWTAVTTVGVVSAKDLNVLFLGDNGHHRPRDRFEQLHPVMAKRGVALTYTDNVGDLNVPNLRQYDAIMLYANIDEIEPTQAQSLLDYVNGGGGFVPLHCATYCFRNSADVVALMGGQFRRHGTGTFRTEIANPDHPVMRGFGGFESWDETYVHHLHNETNRTVLSYRVDDEGREPWTWVRTHGQGRVFYTAWGHDHRTWAHPGFQNLVERGIRWAAGDDPAVVPAFQGDQAFPIPDMTNLPDGPEPFEYADVGAKIPNYTPSEGWGTQGEPLSKMQLPLPAEKSVTRYVTPQGFHLELFVSEPELGGKPISMQWDERGRLWVAETYDYPNELQQPEEGRDRIRICEDTDGDWKADKFTIFADKLSIPTTLMFHNGGVYVQDSTRTLYLKDTDGDDVADERRVVFTGWNQRDTHGGVSNMQYGLDNWIWAMQGYNDSRPRVVGQEDADDELRFSAGFFRFRPDASEIEFIRSTNNNTWGLGISEEGIIFGSTANRCPSVYMPIPNRYYERVRGWAPSLVLNSMAESHLFRPVTDKIRQVDQHGGYTAGAGHALYTARNYPREYWNRVAFVNGPTGHLVGTFVIDRDGADFHSAYRFNLLASDDEWSAPIMSEVGPDGNVWVIDWYNYIVQHNPTPRGFETGRGNAYETDLRDKKHGRVYRLVYDQAGDSKPFDLKDASPQKLVQTLKHPVMLWRRHAQRLLVERQQPDVVPALCELVGDLSVDEIQLNVGAIHALWTLHGLGALDGSHEPSLQAAFAALGHPSAGVRRNAVQVLPHEPSSVEAILAAGVIADVDPQVRLATLLALADLPATDEAGAAVAEAAWSPGNADDRWLADATVSAAANNSLGFLQAVARRPQLSDKQLEQVVIVAEHLGRTAPKDSVAKIVRTLLDARPEVSSIIVRGLAAGWPDGQQPEVTVDLENDLDQLLAKLDTGSRGHLLQLAEIWGSERLAKYSEAIVSALGDKIDDADLSLEQRAAAARELIEFRSTSDETVTAILDRIGPQTSTDLATSLVNSLGGSESPELGRLLTERLSQLTPGVRKTAILVLLNRRAATPSLLDALDSGAIQLAELSLDQRQRLLRHPDFRVRRRATRIMERGGALPNEDRQKVLAEWLPVTETKGDPVEGKLVFTKNCAKCHRHSGEGAAVGPDLTGMAVHPKDELLTHILDPNRSVEGNFRVYNVATVDGQVLAGMLASESRTALELFDAEGKKTSILRDDIEEFVGSQKSLMPEGFEKQLKRDEMTNLLEFLTQRGQFSPLDLAESATIVSDRGMFNGNDGRFVLDDWSPRTVNGVPFQLIDPQDATRKNVIMLHGPIGAVSKKMPPSVAVAVGKPARVIHLLSGISGWGHPYNSDPTISMIVRLHYADGTTEEHELQNGVHFADYIRRVDVPKSEFAFMAGTSQVRFLSVIPQKRESVDRLEFVKGPDSTAPVVLAATIEE